MTDHARQIEAKLVHYNTEYRKGTPVVSDQVFDALLEEFERLVDADNFKRVRESMFDKPGKIRHPYIIGSLRKTKAEDDSVTEWFKKEQLFHHNNSILIVEKIDGMSMVLTYVNGNLTLAASRGDVIDGASYGEDYTHIVRMIPGYAKKKDYTGQIRTELLLPLSALKEINDMGYPYKNPRNAVVGIAGSKTVNPELVKRCSIIAYQIMGSDLDKVEQYNILKDLGFNLPRLKELNCFNHLDVTPDRLKAMYEAWSAASDYEIDGLVIHNLAYGDENLKLPTHTIAFKVNDLVATTTLEGVEWTMSRGKLMKPVGLIKDIELGGATIRRVTMNNPRWMIDRELRIGSTVTIEKAGDIIPKIIDIVPNMSGKLDIPTTCPHCKAPLHWKGTDLACENITCTGANVKQINEFLRNLGVLGFSERSLEIMNIRHINDLLNFYPDGSSNQNKFMSELFGKVFNQTKRELIINLPFNGFGKKQITKVLDTYGKERIMRTNIPVDGMSADRLEEFKKQFKVLIRWVEKITHDNRWKPQAPKRVASPISNKLSGMSFCFTGKLETMSRSEAELYAKSNGAEIKSVSNKLTYLVTNDPTSGSSKNKKAAQLGVQLITEAQFMELIGKKMPMKKNDSNSKDTLFDINDL